MICICDGERGRQRCTAASSCLFGPARPSRWWHVWDRRSLHERRCTCTYLNNIPTRSTCLRATIKTVGCCREAQHELSSGRGGQDIWVACDGLIRSGEQKAQSMNLAGGSEWERAFSHTSWCMYTGGILTDTIHACILMNGAHLCLSSLS